MVCDISRLVVELSLIVIQRGNMRKRWIRRGRYLKVYSRRQKAENNVTLSGTKGIIPISFVVPPQDDKELESFIVYSFS